MENFKKAVISDMLLEAVGYKNGEYWIQCWVSNDDTSIYKDWYNRQAYMRIKDGEIVSMDWTWFDDEKYVRIDWILDLFKNNEVDVLDMDTRQIAQKIGYEPITIFTQIGFGGQDGRNISHSYYGSDI